MIEFRRAVMLRPQQRPEAAWPLLHCRTRSIMRVTRREPTPQLTIRVIRARARVDNHGDVAHPKGEVQRIEVAVGGRPQETQRGNVPTQEPFVSAIDSG